MFKHGFRRGTKKQQKFYTTWRKMKKRCTNPSNIAYPSYGGRGITVCDRWLESFINFKDDMYESYIDHIEEFGEKNTSIDRIEVNGNYEPSNCRWATWTEQARHKRTSTKSINYKQHRYWRGKLLSHLSCSVTYKLRKSLSLELYLGCTLQEFYRYIESQFTKDMTWDNHGKGPGTWQFDHIVGCNNFDLSKEEDRKNCFNYKNLRPLWTEDHKNKSTHLVKV